ncbi:helix-turn-helix domain-containing protein [Coxiella-like endosymbiont]|uniref:helix-turn-helix domain-containing protein n=1 Tax=Coxiella-like endosymbiont TaxID=1592897 RepID=UPI00272BB7AA|nr:helix-turn-helix domain-containing protein [Coxiella-like endosymbiont]
MTESVIEDMEVHTELSNSVIKTPGILLREARQAKNLKYEDVAKQMHLSVQWVKNLEKDNYSQAPALIYVRGYLRAYARCVGLIPEEVIAAFDALALNEEFERIKAREEKPVKHQAVPVISRSTRMISRKTIRWITFLALAILIILVGVWWQGKKHFMVQIQSVMAPSQELPLKETTKESTLPATLTTKNKIIFSGTDH